MHMHAYKIAVVACADSSIIANLIDNFKVEGVCSVGIEATHLPALGTANAELIVRHRRTLVIERHTAANAALNLQLSAGL